MKLVIKGSRPLKGEITLAGAKNGATKLMVATLLTDEECVLKNFPMIGETEITAELCRSLGSEITYGEHEITLRSQELGQKGDMQFTRRNRIPILTLGPLLVRTGKAEVPFVGGDKIGARPVDIHLEALKAMGAEIEVGESTYRAQAPNGLQGAKVTFAYPSIGATENVLLAAVLAKGRTVINNAATEPEVIDLIKFLQNMGAIIELGANRTIYIDGVAKLHGAVHTIIPDRIEAASFGALALASGGKILVRGAVQGHLITFLNAVRRVGGTYIVNDEGILFMRENGLRGVHIETDTHPGFMTDWQQALAVALTQAEGESIIHETVYEDRFGYAQDLIAMGAKIQITDDCLGELDCRFRGQGFMHSAVIEGPTKLHGAELTVRDLRSGIAHVIAALCAEGESVISGVEELDRGYEKIDTRLASLGAEIRRSAE